MDYKIITREAFKVLVMARSFKTESSFTDLPDYWTEYYSKGYNKLVPGMLGICEPEQPDSDEFRYGIGKEYTEGADVPKGYELLTVPENTWAVFKCIGPMPSAMQEVWKRIYNEWLPQADYERIQGYDFEVYTEGNNQNEDYVSEIWIPVRKK